MIKIIKLGLLIVCLLVSIKLSGQECIPKLSYEQSSFAYTTASNNSFTNETNGQLITGTGWTAIGNPDILNTAWLGDCNVDTESIKCVENDEIDILRNDIFSDLLTEDKNIRNGYVDFDASTSLKNDNFLGAKENEGIKCNVRLKPQETYLLRFSQVNARRKRFEHRFNSARWIVLLDGELIEESIFMPLTDNELNPFAWHETLIIIETDDSKDGTQDRVLEIIMEPLYPQTNIFLPDEYVHTNDEDVYTNSNNEVFYNNSRVMNYMLIDNITLIQQGHCEVPPEVTERNNSSFIPKVSPPDEALHIDYVLSAWVKEDLNTQITYTSGIEVSFNIDGTITSLPIFTPKGNIIEGWQRIEETFNIPDGARDISIALKNNANVAFFDDIRIHNAEGNMKSFVYDPITKRLMAELDENNYATLYEYDNEGGLVRVKKETERGIYTIQETRSGNYITNEN